MRVLSALVIAGAVATGSAQALLRTESRVLYPTTYGGMVFAGPTRNSPVNACNDFNRAAETFTNCDGKMAADNYCRERGHQKATTWGMSPMKGKNQGSSWVYGGGQQVEAGIKDGQMVLDTVTCE